MVKVINRCLPEIYRDDLRMDKGRGQRRRTGSAEMGSGAPLSRRRMPLLHAVLLFASALFSVDLSSARAQTNVTHIFDDPGTGGHWHDKWFKDGGGAVTHTAAGSQMLRFEGDPSGPAITEGRIGLHHGDDRVLRHKNSRIWATADVGEGDNVAGRTTSGGFPIDLFRTGAVLPEERIAVIESAKPAGAREAHLSLTAFDGDTPNEGELYVNGNGPVALFGVETAGRDASLHTAAYRTPASWWKDGPNELRFVHTSTHGFRVDSASVSFTTDAAGLPGCLATFTGVKSTLAGDHGYHGFKVMEWEDGARFDARDGVWTSMMRGFDDRRGLVPVQIGADWGTNIDGAGRRDLWSSRFNTQPQPTAFCFFGGTIVGTQPLTATWGETKRLGGGAAITINGTRGSVVEAVRIHNHHDAFVPYRNDGFVFRNNWVSYNRDDCLENDANAEGTVEGNLFDGCYVFYSGTISDADTARPHGAGARGTLRIVNNLIKMQNMPGPYDRQNQVGDRSKLGYEQFWKTRPGAGVPKVVLRDNVIAFEDPRDRGVTDLTGTNVNIIDCANNTILWLGSGSFPGRLPSSWQDCFRVVSGSRALERWRELREQWIAAHPDVARL